MLEPAGQGQFKDSGLLPGIESPLWVVATQAAIWHVAQSLTHRISACCVALNVVEWVG